MVSFSNLTPQTVQPLRNLLSLQPNLAYTLKTIDKRVFLEAMKVKNIIVSRHESSHPQTVLFNKIAYHAIKLKGSILSVAGEYDQMIE